ncbi:YoaK family protein [Spirillospora sp. NPDC052269]
MAATEPGVPMPASRIGNGHPLALTLMTLTLVSGFVDAVSYLGLGRVFTANMTGNVVLLGFAAAGAPGFSAGRSLASLAAFLVGAVCAGRAEAFFRERSRVQWVRSTLVAEAVLQIIATIVAFTADAEYVLIILLALAMGLRNGTVRKLGVPDMTTTVLTLTLTGIASDSSLAGGSNPRIVRRVLAVVAMLAGAFAGAALLRGPGLAWSLAASTVLVSAAAVAYRERL